MRYSVRSDDIRPFTLCESDIVKSVLQNILLIINTPKGSVPMYRDFGLAMSYKDRPQNVVNAIIASEVISAIKKYEPRANVVNTSFEYSNKNYGEIIVIVEVDI